MQDQYFRHDTASDQHSGDPKHNPCHNAKSIASVGVFRQASSGRIVSGASSLCKISYCRHVDCGVVESSSPGTTTACKKDTQEPRDNVGLSKDVHDYGHLQVVVVAGTGSCGL